MTNPSSELLKIRSCLAVAAGEATKQDMPSFSFPLQATGLKVQGEIPVEHTRKKVETYVECLQACGRLHLVNPKTEKVLGPGDDWG